MALLVFMIPPLGCGGLPVITALFLQGLLPMVGNTYAALHEVPTHIRDSAEAIDLARGAKLMLVELAIASRVILATPCNRYEIFQCRICFSNATY
jgi:ABC-type proline/glycine betaine transport system permease subunit